MNTQTATIIPTSYYFIYNGETLPGFIEGDYAYAERRREGREPMGRFSISSSGVVCSK